MTWPSWFAPWDFQKSAGNNFQVGLRSAITRDSRDSVSPPDRRQLDRGLGRAVLAARLASRRRSSKRTSSSRIYERADGSGRSVLALRSTLGWSSDNTPIDYERFYAGGYRSLRGFAFRGVGHFEENGLYSTQVATSEFLNSAEYQDSDSGQRSALLGPLLR